MTDKPVNVVDKRGIYKDAGGVSVLDTSKPQTPEVKQQKVEPAQLLVHPGPGRYIIQEDAFFYGGEDYHTRGLKA